MTHVTSDRARPMGQHLVSSRAPAAGRVRPTEAAESRDLARLLAATAVGLALTDNDEASRILTDIADGDPTAVAQARDLVAALPGVGTEERCAAERILAEVPAVGLSDDG